MARARGGRTGGQVPGAVEDGPRLQARRAALDELRPDPRNPRTHEGNVDAIARSLAQFGQVEPLVVQKGTGRLIGGHGRLEAMRRLGWVACDVVDVDVDDRRALALGLALNKTALESSWDQDLLADVLADVQAGHDPALLAATGFDQEEVDKLQRPEEGGIDQDDVPEVPVIATSRPGDLWLLGKHRLACGDSTDGAVARLAMKGNVPLLMVTDPPYGVEYDPEWRKRAGVNQSEQMGLVRNDDRASWAAAFAHFPGAVAYVWHAARFASEVDRSLVVSGFEVRAQIVWVKRRFVISRGAYHWRHEPCWYAVRGGAKWVGGRKQSTVWADVVDGGANQDLFAAKVDEETLLAFPGSMTTVWEIANDKAAGGGHSTQKPVECMARAIRNHGGVDDAVYEPFSGSGTTLVACEQLGRRCFAVELEPRYVDVAVRRWESLTGASATLEGDGRTFAAVSEVRTASAPS